MIGFMANSNSIVDRSELLWRLFDFRRVTSFHDLFDGSHRLVALSVILLFGASLEMSYADGHSCDVTSSVEEIADGVFVRAGTHHAPFEGENVANIGFIIGQSCVAVIDSGGSLSEGHALKCAAKAATELPVCYLILTHHHFDHVMGSKAFVESEAPVDIVAHENFKPALQQSAQYYRTELAENPDQPLPEDHIVFPNTVVATGEAVMLDLGGRTLEVRALPVAHTNNDLSILDTATDTLWSSDLLFVEHVPALDNGLGSINGWLAEIEKLQAQSAKLAVPGHGPVSVKWPAGADPMHRYLSTVRDEVRAVLAENGTLQRAQDEVGLTESDQWQMFDYHHKRTVIRSFTELEWE